MVQDAIAVVPTFTFLAVRFVLAAGLMAALSSGQLRRARGLTGPAAAMGTLLFAGYALQTFGLARTSVSNAGFLTGLAVVVVPFGWWLVSRTRPAPAAFGGAALAMLGTYLLAVPAGVAVRIGGGDALVIGGAVAFGWQVVAMGIFAPRHDPRALAAAQVAVTGLLAAIAAAVVDGRLRGFPASALVAAVFTGVFATALAFSVQTWAQRHLSPVHTILLLATEPLFTALFAVWVAGESLGPRSLVGGAAIVAAILLSELLGTRRARATAPPSPDT
jgi:drug/metabolite transporter (DMT)-like permease